MNIKSFYNGGPRRSDGKWTGSGHLVEYCGDSNVYIEIFDRQGLVYATKDEAKKRFRILCAERIGVRRRFGKWSRREFVMSIEPHTMPLGRGDVA